MGLTIIDARIDMLSYDFHKYIESFPEDISGKVDELRTLSEEIKNLITKDLKQLRTRLTTNQISVKFNMSAVGDYNYLFKYSLYDRKVLPTSQSEIISFWLSNIYQCKTVIEGLLNQILRIASLIEIHIDGYLARKSNGIFKIFNQFIAYFVHLNQVIRDYNSFLGKIDVIIAKSNNGISQLNDQITVNSLFITSTSSMLENIRECVLTHNAFHDRSYNYSLIRAYLEYLLSENLKIKLTRLFRDSKLLKENENIIFTNKATFYDYVTILRKIKILDEETSITVDRIYDWGNRSLHEGQTVPIHIIWISIYYIFEIISEKVGPPGQITPDELTSIFEGLSVKDKEKIEIIQGRFIPSLYDSL